ncbi:organic cation transporter-like protein [Mizuhopecten yessoensis]|uniref:Solute carrier family 22 member 21 n=1 Tax=Mizuhopecten yessoensis TaxID=6573 RepID=A0A210PS18_MIZYE|nr:organic cation transporter-like protein [Mizuhopecten yessoensis]XP_021376652.1 organic cation transporter-like protein [Mizuhopecten yessoensis]XP_021376653.1 organic cation transporter-like protein [Mizuhopecten yessoensis]OWF39252.1 Solute carrier family 22 member 21 [Mizuhopecten yessoensis]
MSATSAYLESLIEECGGFSRFQWIMFSFMMYSKVAATWTMMMMTFAGAIPDWQCRLTNYSNPGTIPSITTNDIDYIDGQCYPPQNVTVQTCQEYIFSDSMNTVVSEWTLICDKDWIASTITTIQMVGLLVSCVASGHLADLIGRKPTYFLSLIALTVLNTISGFSTTWKMFAVLRFLLGFGVGAHLTVFYGYLIEFIPARRRSAAIAYPGWAIWACVLGLVAMWLHDWRYLHFATAILTLPCVFMWWFLPESFRYLVTHNRLDEAKEVVCKIARINGKPEPDMSKMSYLVKVDLKVDAERRYTIWDVAKSPQLRKYTCLLGIAWIACGYGYYAISFGVQSLSGSLYLNMFLLSVVEIPAQASSYYLTNRYGRKWVTLALLLIAGITGFVVAAIQISDYEMKNSLINGFALASKMGVGVGWGTLIILTSESYPTVVRNIGYGMQSSFARIGAIAAPQLVYVSSHLPGVMYFIFGGVMFLSAFGLFFMQETNKKPIEDGIATNEKGQKETQNFESHTNEAFDTRL